MFNLAYKYKTGAEKSVTSGKSGKSVKSVKSSKSSKGSSAHGGLIDVTGTKYILPIDYGGLGNRFFDQLSFDSDKILQVDTINNITETKGSVKSRGVRLAIEMQAKGVGKNDIILISSKTHSHQTIVLLATLFLGAIVCPINPETPFRECLELVKKLKPKMCFCDSRTVSQIDRILYTLSLTSEIVCFGTEVTGATQFRKMFPYKEVPNFTPFHTENPHRDVAFIIPTQGTCDDPKLVCLSHHNLYLQSLNFMDLFENPSKVISFFPLSWITQTVLACASLEFGVTRIMVANFNERNACKMIHDFVIDVAVLGTELALRLTTNVAIKDYNLNCLKCILVGAVNTFADDLVLMRKALPNVKFIQLYSLTETGLVAAVPVANYSEALEKPKSVGQLLKNCKIKILDINTKEYVGPNRTGELYFHGDGLMLGYFKDNKGTISAIEKGFFRTGDLARYDEDWWLYLEGRINDMIHFENTLFTPYQIEDCIISHPFVHDAVMIGNENELIICIEKKPDAKLTIENIFMYFTKRLPDFDKPISRIVFLEEFPRTSAGHIKKILLREQFLKVKLEYTQSLASIGTSDLDSSQRSSFTT